MTNSNKISKSSSISMNAQNERTCIHLVWRKASIINLFQYDTKIETINRQQLN